MDLCIFSQAIKREPYWVSDRSDKMSSTESLITINSTTSDSIKECSVVLEPLNSSYTSNQSHSASSSSSSTTYYNDTVLDDDESLLMENEDHEMEMDTAESDE